MFNNGFYPDSDQNNSSDDNWLPASFGWYIFAEQHSEHGGNKSDKSNNNHWEYDWCIKEPVTHPYNQGINAGGQGKADKDQRFEGI